jgi:hypothetical protein
VVVPVVTIVMASETVVVDAVVGGMVTGVVVVVVSHLCAVKKLQPDTHS